MKRLFQLAFGGLLVLTVFSNRVLADDDIKVLTQNQYLGADLTPIILSQTPEEFSAAVVTAFTQAAANNFPLRAQRFATQVALTEPDLIGLQEVFDFKLNGANVGPPFVDHLAVTLNALAARGQHYVVAAIVTNFNIAILFDVNGDGNDDLVSVVDRDVILARRRVEFTKLVGNYTEGGLCGVQIPLPPTFNSPLQSSPSEDGCNYTIGVEVDSPFFPDPIIIPRGFVGVDATVRGKKYRFVTTHLEVRQPDPTNPASAILQSLQSVELVETLKATTPPDRTLVLVGDFNSSPEDPITSIIPPYQIIAADFADIWDTNPLRFFNPGGFTCCHLADLSNTMSLLNERIDIIFVRETSFQPLAFVTGQVPIFPLRVPPNWVSDHAGVFGKLTFGQTPWLLAGQSQ
jgi:endonuclease/exonuclease/phosphatase family metal-dependent hydrolase